MHSMHMQKMTNAQNTDVKNKKCRKYGDEEWQSYKKLIQNECKNRHDWVGKVTHWE